MDRCRGAKGELFGSAPPFSTASSDPLSDKLSLLVWPDVGPTPSLSLRPVESLNLTTRAARRKMTTFTERRVLRAA